MSGHLRVCGECPFGYESSSWASELPARAGTRHRTPVAQPGKSPFINPCVCGERTPPLPLAMTSTGSPPHGQGTHRVGPRRQDRRRITPRECREHLASYVRTSYSHGSPPLRRGAHPHGNHPPRVVRITPARVRGNAVPVPPPQGTGSDHPRVCREQGPANRFLPYASDYPRMNGEQPNAASNIMYGQGSPPHRRGARHAVRLAGRGLRTTPAPAGITSQASSARRASSDHPRGCGVHTIRGGKIPGELLCPGKRSTAIGQGRIQRLFGRRVRPSFRPTILPDFARTSGLMLNLDGAAVKDSWTGRALRCAPSGLAQSAGYGGVVAVDCGCD
jgi:hypothetical protein